MSILINNMHNFALPVGSHVADLEMYLFMCKVSTP